MRKTIGIICNGCEKYFNIEKNPHMCGITLDKKVSTEFKPFFSEECKTMITSSRQMDRVYKAHGLRPMGDNPHLKKYQDIAKNKEDYVQEKYRKEGIDYKPGSGMKFSDWRQELVPAEVYRREKAMGR